MALPHIRWWRCGGEDPSGEAAWGGCGPVAFQAASVEVLVKEVEAALYLDLTRTATADTPVEDGPLRT